MYNGIGLQTTRGTGTSGHVQRNVAAVRRPRAPRPFIKSRPRKRNTAIAEHEARRKVEVAVAELEDELQSRGYDQEKISEMTDRLRSDLTAREGVEKRGERDRDIEEGKQRRMRGEGRMHTGGGAGRFREAFAVHEGYKEGDFLKNMKKRGQDKEGKGVNDPEDVRKKKYVNGEKRAGASKEQPEKVGNGKQTKPLDHQPEIDGMSDSSSSLSSSSSGSSLSDGDGEDHIPVNGACPNRNRPRGPEDQEHPPTPDISSGKRRRDDDVQEDDVVFKRARNEEPRRNEMPPTRRIEESPHLKDDDSGLSIREAPKPQVPVNAYSSFSDGSHARWHELSRDVRTREPRPLRDDESSLSKSEAAKSQIPVQLHSSSSHSSHRPMKKSLRDALPLPSDPKNESPREDLSCRDREHSRKEVSPPKSGLKERSQSPDRGSTRRRVQDDHLRHMGEQSRKDSPGHNRERKLKQQGRRDSGLKERRRSSDRDGNWRRVRDDNLRGKDEVPHKDSSVHSRHRKRLDYSSRDFNIRERSPYPDRDSKWRSPREERRKRNDDRSQEDSPVRNWEFTDRENLKGASGLKERVRSPPRGSNRGFVRKLEDDLRRQNNGPREKAPARSLERKHESGVKDRSASPNRRSKWRRQREYDSESSDSLRSGSLSPPRSRRHRRRRADSRGYSESPRRRFSRRSEYLRRKRDLYSDEDDSYDSESSYSSSPSPRRRGSLSLSPRRRHSPSISVRKERGGKREDRRTHGYKSDYGRRYSHDERRRRPSSREFRGRRYSSRERGYRRHCSASPESYGGGKSRRHHHGGKSPSYEGRKRTRDYDKRVKEAYEGGGGGKRYDEFKYKRYEGDYVGDDRREGYAEPRPRRKGGDQSRSSSRAGYSRRHRDERQRGEQSARYRGRGYSVDGRGRS